MGGNTFATILPDASFPRMPTNQYISIKSDLTLLLGEFYTHVAVPHETPGKTDHGDIDFVVHGPRQGVTMEDVRVRIGAAHALIPNSNRMCHFAIPALSLPSSTVGQVYHQVDIEVCGELDEWERTVFFRSYGDLGMILGLLAKPWRLTLGSSGLRVSLLTVAPKKS